MNGKFFDLKKEKQDRMINAALKVFALNGYRHASTDEIVQEAAISKGLLFHYFESKLGLYTFIYDYSVKYLSLELKSAVSGKETDPFVITKQIEQAKLQALRGYPYMQQFITRSMSEDVSEALLAIEDMRNIMIDTYDSLQSRMDFSRFPKEVEGSKLIKMLDFTIKGLMSERFLNASFHPDMLYEEILEYVDMVKKLTYGS
ncbi:MAG TPA: TetR/AcrR family transcriptional regulator [Lachnospiraceae bacterium]|nr:TetR/AcrR family transcriptional regulator [Lachnospiraceae bacterium]